jgi:hypothetical protein
MKIEIPEVPANECTPLVVRLLEIIHVLSQRIQQLEDEVAQLKGLPTRPKISPSTLEQPAPQPRSQGQKRPGSDKRPKNALLTIHRQVVLPVPERPDGSTFKGYEDFIVQELHIHVEAIRYRRERWATPDGRTLVAALPKDVLPGSHFGPELITYILHQYHDVHVTQPALLEQLRQFGIDISAGQLNRIITEDKDSFHQEKEELLPAGLQVSSYVGVDDTGARHQGQTGSCLHIGNDLFAYFHSSESKSRLNFLEVLRQPHTDYVVNEVARVYWQRQKLPAALLTALSASGHHFADAAAWQAHLVAAGAAGERHARSATEGALLGSLIEHGVSPQLVILSDGAPQFDVLAHAACWIHAERPLARMVPFSDQHRTAIAQVRQRIWELYQDLKAYRQSPTPSPKAGLEARFDALCAWRTGFTTVDGVLKEMAEHKADLLRVLERAEVPLHNNLSENHLRDYVKKRKISGGTRSVAGRRCRDTFASLKKTCRELGVNFWEYLRDRVRGLGLIARLAELIRQRAGIGRGESVLAAPA